MTGKPLSEDMLSEIIRRYESPVLIFDQQVMERQFRKLQHILEEKYSNAQIAYSVKTNYIPALISIFKKEGALAEVVSDFEYWLAQEVGYAPKDIILNGPGKSSGSLRDAMLSGAKVNIGSFEELSTLFMSDWARGEICIGIRVNTNLGAPSHKRFGFNLENGEVYEAVAEIKKHLPGCRVVGLHSHLGSLVEGPALSRAVASLVSDCAIALEKDWGQTIEYLDFGGGFPVPGMRLDRRIYWNVPDVDSYISELANVLHEKFPTRKPLLIVEPGRYLIQQAGMLVATVLESKQIPFPKGGWSVVRPNHKVQMITVDTSRSSVLKNISDAKHIKIVGGISTTKKLPTYIVGNSCINHDYLSAEVMLPPLQKGERVLFSNAGAYTASFSQQFIHPRPAAVLVNSVGNTICIQRKESFEDMISRSPRT